MGSVTFTLVLITGALLAGGVVALVTAFMPRTPDLVAVVGGLVDPTGPVRGDERAVVSSGSRSERFGGWLARRSPIPVTAKQLQNLRLRNKSVPEFYADKAVLALIGLILPTVVAAAVGVVTHQLPIAVPVLAALGGGVIGFFIPDLQLRGQAGGSRSDAGAALLTYIDLVTLERLANASATQALHNAANLSEITLFRQIRGALERARLEQQPPFGELRRLAVELDLAELTDLADVMQLDESGAALSGSLRARVRELRDAHQANAQREANAVSEGMTIYMTIPALVFGLIFMVPPLLRIVGG